MSSDPDHVEDHVEDRLAECLRQSFHSLENAAANGWTEKVTEQQIQCWARLICKSMMTPARLYHDADHVVEVLDNLKSEVSSGTPDAQPDPISQLAVLFHDIVYYSLDRKLSPEQYSLLKDVIKEDETDGQAKVSLVPFSVHQDPAVFMVKTVFGMPENEPLPNIGENEFLSALVAVRALGRALSKEQLLQLAVLIEATIPFRPVDTATGKSSMDHLYDRSLEAYSKFVSAFVPGIVEADADSFISNAAHQAVIVANSDLGAFSNPDPTSFIDSNWRLLPEWFPILLNFDKCTLNEYQHVLASVRQRPMDPSIIFLSFRGVPDAMRLAEKRQRATTNLTFLRNYMGIRILTMAMLMELTECAHRGSTLQLADLSMIEQAAASHGACGGNYTRQGNVVWKDPLDSQIYQVLKYGRRVGYSWDAKKSPLAAILFVELGGSEAVSRHLKQQEETSSSSHNTMAWLKSLPKSVISVAVQGIMTALPELEAHKGKLSKLLGLPSKHKHAYFHF